ncbi:MAG: PIN domain-containing protein [Chloroflexi bacterium]|nr:PIN domain-containing protein [Chloroflexota bacterium]MBI4197966.1 PIN domain-containing protein [Chloroflexota bacterium]
MSAFVDTDIVVRYLTGVPAHMAQQAASLLDHAPDLLLTDAVIAETAYVLRTRYSVERTLIVDSLLGLLGKDTISVFGRDKAIIVQALLLCRPSGRVSFDDALLWAAARSSGVNVVYSFDSRFPREGVEVRGP